MSKWTKAVKYAAKVYEGRDRPSGKTLLQHCLQLSAYAIEYDPKWTDGAIALLLRLAPSLGGSFEYIKEKFGSEVVELIVGLTDVRWQGIPLAQVPEDEDITAIFCEHFFNSLTEVQLLYMFIIRHDMDEMLGNRPQENDPDWIGFRLTILQNLDRMTVLYPGFVADTLELGVELTRRWAREATLTEASLN